MDSIPVYNVDDSISPAIPKPLHIASLIVHVRPSFVDEVAGWLEQQKEVEIHTQSPTGKFAVVMECDHEQAVLDLLDTLDDKPGVLNSALIYHEIVDVEEEEDAR